MCDATHTRTHAHTHTRTLVIDNISNNIRCHVRLENVLNARDTVLCKQQQHIKYVSIFVTTYLHSDLLIKRICFPLIQQFIHTSRYANYSSKEKTYITSLYFHPVINTYSYYCTYSILCIYIIYINIICT